MEFDVSYFRGKRNLVYKKLNLELGIKLVNNFKGDYFNLYF